MFDTWNALNDAVHYAAINTAEMCPIALFVLRLALRLMGWHFFEDGSFGR